jgi:hypothetical protein
MVCEFLPQVLFGSLWVIGQFHWNEELEMARVARRHSRSLSHEPKDCKATICHNLQQCVTVLMFILESIVHRGIDTYYPL